MSLLSSHGRTVERTTATDGLRGLPSDVVTGATEGPSATDDHAGLWGLSPRMVQAALTVLLCLPLIVALVVLRHPRWFPILDLAMTELRVRDVGTSESPLIGLPGRIGVFGAERGSHPGPLSFWLLAPTYRLLGASAWTMEVGAVVLHGAATSLALWLGRRRGGVAVMVGLAAVLALLMRTYGADVLTQPWNPYLPLLWWVVLLLAVWSVLCRDIVALPVAVFAASFCAQTHVPYVGLAGGLAVLTLVGVVAAYRHPADSLERRRVLRWIGGSAVLGVVLWLPVVLDQVTVEPGNVSLMMDHLLSPPEEPVGIWRGVQMVLLHLDPWRFVTAQGTDAGSLAGASSAPTGSYLPGVILLVLWLGAVVGAWRLRHQALLRLHLLIGVGLVLASYSIGQIFGLLWYYLMIWAWGLTALVLLAIGWTVAAVVARRTEGTDPRRLMSRRSLSAPQAGVAALLALTVVSTAVFAVDAASVEQPADLLSTEMAVVTPEIVTALADGTVSHRGRDERYLVTWTDSVNIGAQGIALVNELERSGFDVGVVRPWSVHVSRHRARPPGDATSAVHLATGTVPVATWRSRPDAVEIASVDLRTPAERSEFDRVRRRVLDDLRAEGLVDVAALVDENLFLAAIDERLTDQTHDDLTRMLDLGQPSAAFVGPVSMLG